MKKYQTVTAEEAVKVIKSGDHVHISSVSNVPQCLVKALCDRGRAGELKNVYIHHPKPHSLVHHGVWRGQPLRKVASGKGEAHHLGGASTVPGTT